MEFNLFQEYHTVVLRLLDTLRNDLVKLEASVSKEGEHNKEKLEEVKETLEKFKHQIERIEENINKKIIDELKEEIKSLKDLDKKQTSKAIENNKSLERLVKTETTVSFFEKGGWLLAGSIIAGIFTLLFKFLGIALGV